MSRLNDYLKSSNTLDEFIQNADREIAEHILQTTGKEPMSDDIKTMAEDLWINHCADKVPF